MIFWLTFFVSINFYTLINAESEERRTRFFELATFGNCEGNEPNNYTLSFIWTRKAPCLRGTGIIHEMFLTSNGLNGEKSISQLKSLIFVDYREGDKDVYEGLNQAVSGPLAAKFIYLRRVRKPLEEMKKCSAPLGLTYIAPDSYQMLISNELDPQVLISPTGALKEFKKSATTVCNRINGIIV